MWPARIDTLHNLLSTKNTEEIRCWNANLASLHLKMEPSLPDMQWGIEAKPEESFVSTRV